MTQPFISVSEDKQYLIISRCAWIYPQATEDEAGLRDEERYARLGHSDGDIVLRFAPGASKDVADAEMILTDMFNTLSTKAPR